MAPGRPAEPDFRQGWGGPGPHPGVGLSAQDKAPGARFQGPRGGDRYVRRALERPCCADPHGQTHCDGMSAQTLQEAGPPLNTAFTMKMMSADVTCPVQFTSPAASHGLKGNPALNTKFTMAMTSAEVSDPDALTSPVRAT